MEEDLEVVPTREGAAILERASEGDTEEGAFNHEHQGTTAGNKTKDKSQKKKSIISKKEKKAYKNQKKKLIVSKKRRRQTKEKRQTKAKIRSQS